MNSPIPQGSADAVVQGIGESSPGEAQVRSSLPPGLCCRPALAFPSLVSVVGAELASGKSFGQLCALLIILSGLLTVAWAAAYLLNWLRHMSGNGEGSKIQN